MGYGGGAHHQVLIMGNKIHQVEVLCGYGVEYRLWRGL